MIMAQSLRGRPAKSLNQYQDKISNLFQNSNSAKFIIQHLHQEYNIHVNRRTLQRRLKEWGYKR